MIKKLYALCGTLLLVNFILLANNTDIKKVKNIILLIGDGMGLPQTYSGYLENNMQLNIFSMPVTGLSKTTSANNKITDSAAGGTAISTGNKTNNGMLAIDSTGKKLETIVEIANRNGLATGVVVTCELTHATPASFLIHCIDRGKYEDIAHYFLQSKVDLIIGGGYNHFAKRKDNKNLVDSLQACGFTIFDSVSDIKLANRVLCFTSKTYNQPIYKDGKSILPVATEKAINFLNNTNKGFFLMVEGSQIDWGGHYNVADYVNKEVIDFDKAVKHALDFAKADGNTLVIVTADHETGGLTLTGSTKINKKPKVEFSTLDHTAIPVIVYAYGPGSEAFTGFYENTEIFYKMINALQIK